MAPARDPELQALLDRQAIADVLNAYCRAIDRADLDLLAAAYHSDATEDHGGTFKGLRVITSPWSRRCCRVRR